MANLVETARVFATARHAAIGQVRKYTGEPYIVHPAAVVEILESVGCPDWMLAAGWLHDVVEDCGVSLDYIFDHWGWRVSNAVDWMTNRATKADGNRRRRFEIDMARQARATPQAKTIRLADIIDNTRNIHMLDPDFASVYLREKEELLDVLHGGDVVLWDRANTQIARHLAALPR